MRTLLCLLCLLLGAVLAGADDQPKPQADAPKRPDFNRLFEQNDKNKDGFIDKSEAPEGMQRRFDQLDANKDGKLSKEELLKGMPNRPGAPGTGRPMPPSAATPPAGLFELIDTNKDDKLSKDELQNAGKLLERLDKNKDGALDREELTPAASRGGKPGEIITPAAKGERKQDTLKVGDLAPDFTLSTVDGKKEVKLSSFRGQKPVVLVFASYT